MDDKSIIALYTKGDLSNLEEKHLLALMEMARGDQARKLERERPKVNGTQILAWVSSNTKGDMRFFSLIKPKVCQNSSGVWYDYSVDFSKTRMLTKQEFNQYGLQLGELGVFELRRVE